MRRPNEFPDNINNVRDLVQDIVQNVYGDYCVDVGWYPSHDLNGGFIGRVIRNGNWEEPLEEIVTRDLEEIKDWHYYRCAELFFMGKLDNK